MRTRPSRRPLVRGFTLMEMIITVAIVAILTAVAVPSYTAYVDRGKRAAARSGLLEAASFLERNFTTNGCYNRTTVNNCQAQSGDLLALPATLARSPSNGRASYAVTVDFSVSATGQAYTLTATPCGSGGSCPAGSDPFKDSKCGALTLTQAGVRGRSGAESLESCWQR